MSLNQYQTRALSTAFYPHHSEGGHPHALAYVGLKLNGEAGEVAEKLGKYWREEGDLVKITGNQKLDVLDELGDLLWYAAALASECGVSLGTVAEWNLRKLQERQRYGAGGWTDERKADMMCQLIAERTDHYPNEVDANATIPAESPQQ